MRQKNSFARLGFMSVMVMTACLSYPSLVASQQVGPPNATLSSGVAKDQARESAVAATQSSNFDLPSLSKKAFFNTNAPSTAAQGSGVEGWEFEIRPYIWLAGIDGTLRVRDTTAEVGKGTSDVLGMLDFAAAAQVEAIRGRWRLMFDENYVNLGTTGTGPLGLVTIEAEPTMNIFEFGASYTMVSVPNKNATATDPLPPIFSAEILGGGRFFHLGLELKPSVGSAVEGSRNFVGPFVGNRFKFAPNKAVTLIGKYTVGGSGAGSKTAWSAEGLVDLRLKKTFSVSGGYRVLGMNTDESTNTVGFDGQLRGFIFSATLYR